MLGAFPFSELVAKDFVSAHALRFFSRKWDNPLFDIEEDVEHWDEYNVGTCIGQWRVTDKAVEILSFLNTERGNGHFEDVMQWFEFIAKAAQRPIVIYEVWNEQLRRHLTEKRGFVLTNGNEYHKHI